MPNYAGISNEETLKAQVFSDFFDRGKHAYTPNIGNIDFVVTAFTGALFPLHLLWAEAKKNDAGIADMFTQLLLTCKKTVDRGFHLPPPYLGVFDAHKIAFAPFYVFLPLFNEHIDWEKTVPHDYKSASFQKLRGKAAPIIAAHSEVFQFETDEADIKAFVKKNLREGGGQGGRIKINKNNFVHIYYKWVKEVKPFINMADKQWADYKQAGIFDCDFFRADMMSENGNSIKEKLEIILRNDAYDRPLLAGDLEYHTEIGWADGGEAYKKFWSKYERPPSEEYRDYIVARRDLLVDQNIREIRGEFFTPPQWVELSQGYLARAFGEDWQREFYIWDCCAGEGNLLVGLQEADRIWASDVTDGNVKTMKQLAHDRRTLRASHIFKFDFLNDGFEKLPAELQEIIENAEKRKKLIVYINPPYAEAANMKTPMGTGANKTKVAASDIYNRFSPIVGTAARELFAQFFLRIHEDIPDCRLAAFSTLKYINASNFEKFRLCFKAEFIKGFIIPAYTFDNVKGSFPIGFLIWNLENKKQIAEIETDVYSKENTFLQIKKFCPYEKDAFIIDWLRKYYDKNGEQIAYLRMLGTDFQNNNGVFITNELSKNDLIKHLYTIITKNNVMPMSIYFTARHIFEHTWINHNDQFLYPNDGWEKDIEFPADCLIYTLFHGKNNISCKHGANHWIPFSEEELGIDGKFKSRFMSNFLKNPRMTRINTDNNNLFIRENPCESADKLKRSPEAQAVLDAGRKLFRYYHEKTRANKKAPLDASSYDIREFFQGRNDKGKMNSASADDAYTGLLLDLRAAQKALAQRIAPKIYEYGFLRW